jgi:hypothetical protein
MRRYSSRGCQTISTNSAAIAGGVGQISML